MEYGYIRVSTIEQNLARQIDSMQSLGLGKGQIFMDKQSGKDFQRKGYQRLLKRLRENDILYIKSIDRLGRNYDEILEQWRYIIKCKKADIVVLDMPILDTRKEKNLMGVFISDIFLQVLSFVAQTERDNIKQRQREGIDSAMRRGVKFGRPIQDLPTDFFKVCKRVEDKEISQVKGAKMLGMPVSTFRYKYARNYQGAIA